MKNKKVLIIILVVVVVLLIAGFFTYRGIKAKQQKELEEIQYKQLVYDYSVLSDKSTVKYYSLELMVIIGFRASVLADIYADTSDYWMDYINYDVYGKSKSKYKLKTFDAAIEKRDGKHGESIKMLNENKELALDVKKALNAIDEHSDKDTINNKKVNINFIDAFVNLHDSVLIIATSYYGYGDSFGTAVSAYNKAYEELGTYSKVAHEYLDKYKKFVVDNDLEKYCDFASLDSDVDKDSPVTYFQQCDTPIRKQFGLELYEIDSDFMTATEVEEDAVEG